MRFVHLRLSAFPTRQPMFQHVDAYPGDPILTLNEDFQKDPRQGKINLSIGIYFDEEGRLPVMDAVRAAETELLSHIGPKPYLPMTGNPAYRQAVQELLFGAQHEAVTSGRIATIQTQIGKSTRLNSSHSSISYAVFCL